MSLSSGCFVIHFFFIQYFDYPRKASKLNWGSALLSSEMHDVSIIHGLTLSQMARAHLRQYQMPISVVGNGSNAMITLVNVNAPEVATTSWWLHFLPPAVA